MKDFFGIAVYTIHDERCLNGVWTNTNRKGIIYNEIAYKKDVTPGLSGTYNSSYITDTENYKGEIIIEGSQESGYELQWKIDNKTCFTGKGFRFDNKLVVSYITC